MVNRVIYSLFFISIFGSSIAQTTSIGGYNVYYGHLHNHNYIGGSGSTVGTPDEAYSYAKNVARLDFFGTANHVSSIESSWGSIKAAANKYNEDGVFTTFWGFETPAHSGNGHLAVINTDDYTTESVNSFEEHCAWLDARNCVAFFNHPGIYTESIMWEGFATTPIDKIVGMELFNTTDDYSVHYYNDGFYKNDGGLNYYAEANSRGWKIGASGSDDNHIGTWGTRTDWRMAILSNHLSRPELFAAMQARRFYSTLDKNLALSFKIGANEMGSTIEGEIYDIQIQARDNDGESFTKVMLFRDGFEMNTWHINTSDVDLSLPIHTFDSEFYYIKVTQSDGDEAISSPIFIEGGYSRPSCSISTPEKGANFDNPQSITIEAEVTDVEGIIASVEFFVDGISLGTDTLAPYSVDYTIPDNGYYEITAKVMDNTGYWVTSSSSDFWVGIFSITASSRIDDGLNDGQCYRGDLVVTDTIPLTSGGYGACNSLRFTDLNISQGAFIDSAFIQFTAAGIFTGSWTLSIRGHDTDNSHSLYDSEDSITSAEVIWELAEWQIVGAAGPDQRTPNLSSIIQEIVNRPGYTKSSAITIIIRGSGGGTGPVVKAYEGDPGSAALLTVDYKFDIASSILAPEFDGTDFHIYPNPVNDLITIKTNNLGLHTIEIHSLNGQQLYRTQMEGNTHQIDLSYFQKGVYLITIRSKDIVTTKKIIIL